MESLKKFSAIEKKIVAMLLSLVFILSAFNMNISIRRGRDSLRKNDMSALQKALDLYHSKYHKFPASVDGAIAACKGPIFIPCRWGVDSFENFSTLPRDPQSHKGYEYLYLSDSKGYAIYIALEGKDEAEYDPDTEKIGLQCGSYLCNYGRVYNFR